MSISPIWTKFRRWGPHGHNPSAFSTFGWPLIADNLYECERTLFTWLLCHGHSKKRPTKFLKFNNFTTVCIYIMPRPQILTIFKLFLQILPRYTTNSSTVTLNKLFRWWSKETWKCYFEEKTFYHPVTAYSAVIDTSCHRSREARWLTAAARLLAHFRSGRWVRYSKGPASAFCKLSA